MSDLAQQLLAENKATKDNFLDLGNCGLTEIPAGVADLNWLEFLSLAGSWLEWDREGWHKVGSRSHGANFADLGLLARLPHLRHLYLAETGAVSLSPLSDLVELRTLDVFNTQVADLGPVCRLVELQSLDVSNTQVVDLSPLSGLVRLQTLDISDTQVVDLGPLSTLVGLQNLNISGTQVADLGPLSRLAGLQKLNISRTQVADLSPLSGLAGLEKLNVSRTQVADLSPLSKLVALQRLDVSNTRVADLAPLVALMHRSLQVRWSLDAYLTGDGVYVANCPLTNPPPELAAQGNIAILNYFAERAQGGVDHLYEAKMLIVGEGGAGKTSLLRRLYSPDDPLPTEGDSTKGIKIYRHEFTLKNGRTFRLNVWDFGGQQIYHATHQFFLTQRSLYVLVDDTRKDYKSASDEGFKYWLELIEVFGGHSPTLIFQNEKSGRSKAIDLAGIKQRYDNVKELYAGNLERRDAAEGIRDGIEFFASHLSHIGEELPARWLKVREEIEKLAVEQAYVPVEKYYELYGKHIEFDEGKALLLSRYFHDLGVFLHFQDDMLLKRTVILQNEWATEAVFRILDDEAVKRKRGRFGKEDYARLWKDSAYARMHLELLALMKNFELCYELRDSDPAKWLAPQLLSPTKPDAVGNWAKVEDLVLRYKYAFLPKGMISRLTVRLHRFVKDPEKAWRTGVLFEYGSSSVLAEILLSGNEIELRARGPEHKALLSVIAADLDALNESFKGLREKVGKLVPCYCQVCAKEATPAFFLERDLLRRKEHGRVKVECGRSYEEVDVVALLDGIRMGEAPALAREDVRTIRIFLASSAELEKDRDEFDSYFRRQNDLLINKGIYLEIVRWEYFIGAMSRTRLQDEYNRTIRECDIIVCLFFTKAGRFTEEEFDVAFRKFKDTGRPRIFTFFKKASVDIDSLSVKNLQSLEAFQQKLNDLGHFYARYEDSQDLKLQFRDQLDSLIEKSGL